ncbi:MAG: HD-GYP domain-containing protein [Gammaproteobacteria bacterium]|nr:HD-GYP domain-containing protein [Gammaproteobacteria bacterium]
MESAKKINDAFLEKVDCNDLKAGMFVQELDRPWLETPFMFQGFRINNKEEIQSLQKYCEYVFINKTRSQVDPRIIHETVDTDSSEDTDTTVTTRIKLGTNTYPDTAPIEEELDAARTIYEQSNSAVSEIFSTAGEDGAIDVKEAKKTTTGIVESVLRNPDAFMLLQRMKNKNRYRYTHAINSCALAATFCRHLGFSKTEIHDISMGALMLDVGTTRLPDSLIDMEEALNPVSMKLVRHHVQFGMEILDNTPDLPPVVREMLLTHHERINGKGYPAGLSGDQIPVSGRIAAIIDCYDAMISSRPYRKKISPVEAISILYNWRNIDFQEDLIEQFIQCIGAYPTGSLVELSSGQVGIVMSQNRVRRLYPRILLILTADGNPYESPQMLDLWEYAQQTRSDKLEISKVVDADELGIDPSDYYL